VAAAYQFYGKNRLSAQDFVKLCYISMAANTSINEILVNTDQGEDDAKKLLALQAKTEYSVDE
jgi:hypothetical protein